MKKGFRGTGTVERVDFPNKGIAVTDDGDRVIVKNTIPGQKVEFVVNKVKHQRAEGRLMEVIASGDRRAMSSFWNVRGLYISDSALRKAA